jgi:DNA-binding response OmpR family regulator
MEKKTPFSRIMIIDDDVNLLEELKEILAFNHYHIDIVSNSEVAFDKAYELKPDLIITDLRMRPKSGFQLVEELHNSYVTKDIPIIAMTGFFNKEEDKVMMKIFGIEHSFLKPFFPSDLIAKIDLILGESKSPKISSN